ncbi:MAG: hypothetical protein U1F42_07955 [Candidatus Competibacteraceae bacterium]
MALIRATLRAVLAEQRAVRESDALKRALLGLALDADYVFDLHCDGEALLHLYASRWQADEARELGAELGAATILLEEDPGGSPFDGLRGAVVEAARGAGRRSGAAGLFCDHGGTTRSGGCER